MITPLERGAGNRRNLKTHWHRQVGLVFATRLAREIGGTVPAGPREDRRWMLETYRRFRGAFRTAKDNGLMFFW